MTDITANRVSTDRLKQIAHAIADGNYRELTMRIPAEPDRDADLVISAAADEIDRLRAEVARLTEANRYLIGISNEAMEDARKYAEAQREIARLREALHAIANRFEGSVARIARAALAPVGR